jgi:hypothetical protein
MNAEQYRALVQKLEAIQEADGMTTEPPNMAAAMDTAAPAVDANAPATAPTTTTTAAADPNQIPTIEAATFSQAYAQAAKQGLKKFKWCGIYAVKAKPRPVQPQPGRYDVKGKVDYTNQPSPLGGDAQNPMSFAPNSNFGA